MEAVHDPMPCLPCGAMTQRDTVLLKVKLRLTLSEEPILQSY